MNAIHRPILYTQAQRLDLQDYGILVPLRGSRATQVLADLETLGQARGDYAAEVVDAVITVEDVARVHTPAYTQLLMGENPEAAVLAAYELIDAHGNHHRYRPETASRPFTDLIQRSILEASGTLKAAEMALEQGFCHFLGGGMHHAMADRGRGFCLMHDVMIAVRRLQAEGRIESVWIIDTDAHKGDGTAALALGDGHIETLSIHMARHWPLDEAPLDEAGRLKDIFYPSTVDIPIPEGCDAHYLSQLEGGLAQLKLRSAFEIPDLAIVVAGSDPSALDILPSAGGLQLDLPTLLQRDTLVYDWLAAHGVPQAWVMAGGYGDEVWRVHGQFLKHIVG